MDRSLRFLLFGLVVLQVCRVALLARRRADLVRPVRRAVRWWMWLLAPVILALVWGTALLLLAVPGLDWGWGRLIGVDSNALLAPVADAANSSGSSVTVWLERGGALVLLGLLGYAMPLFVLSEERIFRRGVEQGGARRWLKATVGFGLVHIIMGIPIGVALALSWGGLVFALLYRGAYRRLAAAAVLEPTPIGSATYPRVSVFGSLAAPPPSAWLEEQACFVSAAAHLVYNVELLAVLALALVIPI